MTTAVLSLPHLGPQARGLLDRIVASGQQGVPRDDVAEWVLARLLALDYVEPHPLDSAVMVHTPAGLQRWQIEMLAEEQRAAERLRRQLIRHRVEARGSGYALVPAGSTLPRIAEPRMRVAPAVRPLPAISGPLAQALPAIAGPAAPSTASERLGARRHRTYTLAATLGAATSLAALLLSSLGPSDPFALFQHPARHAAVAVSPAAAKPRHPVQQAAVLPPPADAVSPAATIQRVSEPVAPRQAVPPPEHSEAVAEPMQQPKPAATRVMPAAAAARPAAVTHAAASAAKPPPVQVARSASTLAEPTPVQDAKPVKASRIAVSPAPPPVVGVAQAASLPAHGMLRAEHASKPVPAVDTAAPPAPPPMVRVASVTSPAKVADPEPAAAPDPKSIHVAEPAPPQTARASAVRQVDVVQASDARPASIVPATPAKSAAVPAAGDTPTAPQETAGEQHVAGAVSKPVHASRVAEADRPDAKPVRAAEKPAVAHPVRHELAETGAATHRKQIVGSERHVAARRPLSGHAEVERLNEQSLAAARKGREYHPAASVQAAAPVHRAAQAM